MLSDSDKENAIPDGLPRDLIDFDKLVTIISRLAILCLMVYLFVRLNNNVMELVNRAYLDDTKRSFDSRLITPDVIMSLIGATAAQVGISIVAIIKWLFPER
jgi:hypothetical protein